MNQILDSNIKDINKKNSNFNNKKEKKNNFFKIQFLFSSFIAIICLVFYLYFYSSSNKEEILSKKIVDNFNISRLYSNTNQLNTGIQVVELPTTYEIDKNKFTVIGLIEIPSISITYPIISEMKDEFLKIAPCRFYGPLPNQVGNMCIAGHNYENYKFFSRIRELQNGNSIFIYDEFGNKLEYLVYKKYETTDDDLNCVNQDTNNLREITLVTCNNVTGNRIIIKAKEK